MYYTINGCHGHVKLTSDLAWEMIKQIIESGQETLLKRSFRLSI